MWAQLRPQGRTPRQQMYRFTKIKMQWHLKIWNYPWKAIPAVVNWKMIFFPLMSGWMKSGKNTKIKSKNSFVSCIFSSVQSLSHVWLFVTPWTAAHQASLSITNSWSPPKPMSIESVMQSNHLILCCPLLLSSIRIFSSESCLHIRWPKF